MIGKIIRMNRGQRRTLSSRIPRLRDTVFTLTRYVVDADPYRLLTEVQRGVVSLVDYALAVEGAGVEPGEKVEAYGTRNLHGQNLQAWQAEMLAVAASAARVEIPLIHIILSLKDGEKWSEEEREEAITIVLQTLRLERCQVLWAEHSNTKNAHLHLSIIRVDPLTGMAAGTDWLVDDLHQALALVVERQKRSREPSELYVARDGAVYDADTNLLVRDAAGRYISDWYKSKGKKHDGMPVQMRPVQASIVDVADRAFSWSALHEELAELGVAYERAGSGARIRFKGLAAKASDVHSALSLPELEKRLGTFEPHLARLNPGHEAYRAKFDAQLAELRRSRDNERARVNKWKEAAVEALPDDADNRLARFIRAEAKAAEESIVAAFNLAIKGWIKHRLNEQQWKAAGEPAAPPEAMFPRLLLPAVADGVEHSWSAASAFEQTDDGWATEYHLADGTPLFTDHRLAIVVHATDRQDALGEALHLAAARWGAVTVRGPERFVNMVAVRAEALGIDVRDDGGQPLRALIPEVEEKPVSQVAKVAAPDWKAPILQEDPARQKRIADAIAFLDKFPGLPLRRRPGGAAGEPGMLEIMTGEDSYDPRQVELDPHAIFDEDPVVQKFLEEKRAAMLTEWRSLLLKSSIDPNNMSRERVQATLLRTSDLRVSEVKRPASLAHDDADFQQMLREVREELLVRRREAPLQKRPLPPGDAKECAQRLEEKERTLPSRTPQPQPQAPASSNEFSVGDLYAYQQAQAARAR